MKIGIDQTEDRMSIRQRFVKAAMQGLVPEGKKPLPNIYDQWIAEQACKIADATLKHELETRGEQDVAPPIREPRDNALA